MPAQSRGAFAAVGDATDNFVAGDTRIGGVVPLVASLVKVGMTNAAEEDLHRDVGGAGFAAGNRERGQGGGGGLRRVGFGAGCIHGQTIVRDLSASTGWDKDSGGRPRMDANW